ncbi:hypothetical protein VOI54_07660 [Tamlana sp. 2201CG12-4]|uniref:hypothetical protein n=1 Tax=Tamlana sp. 2201CG12-4 TaxID=3112582 RepID=UPI002DBAC504|nr:hypothetical protein [Tamlana sp. 2201CG12-4]MEC3906891.1 hypothetical protein [Tamlana sp. 2201CG12-4]
MKKIMPQNIISLKPSWLLLVIILLSVLSCASKKTTSKTKPVIEATPKIIFLTYSISKSNTDNRIIEYVNQKTVDGKIKIKSSESITNGKEGDLICSQLDNKSNILNSTLIKDPLNKIVEFTNESMQFQTQTISIDKTMFSVRLQLNINTKYITISTFADNKKPLIKTKIN